MGEKTDDCKCRIDKVETTSDTLTGRGGLAPFVNFLKSREIIDFCVGGLSKLRKSSKGISLNELMKQMLCFFMDGTNLSISHFDRLREDEGYAAAIQTSQSDMASSHQIKRFFAKLGFFVLPLFRKKLLKFFRWRLKAEKPKYILLNVDPMVMDNEGAEKRQGVEPTYKGVKGFQPFQVSWGPYIVDAIFRGGSKSGNHGNTVVITLKKLIKTIRDCLGEEIPIVVLFDAGFMDQKIFKPLERLNVGYVTTGKLYKNIIEQADSQTEDNWYLYNNGKVKWQVTSFKDQRGSWDEERRLLFLRREQEENGQTFLPSMRPESVFYTNIGMGDEVDEILENSGLGGWKEPCRLVQLGHSRGSDELTWRAEKEFGTEKMPFDNFYSNAAYYYIMIIGLNAYEAYKRELGSEIVSEGIYPDTFRRRFIDIAAKVVRTGGEVILKVTDWVWKHLRFEKLWERACSPHAVPLLH